MIRRPSPRTFALIKQTATTSASSGGIRAAPGHIHKGVDCVRRFCQASQNGASLDPLVFGDRWIVVRSGLTRDTGPLPRPRLRPFGSRVDPGIHNGLDGEAHGYVSRAAEHLKNLVADQTTELAPAPLFG